MRVEALRPLELAFIDQPLGAQIRHRRLDLARSLQLGFGREDVVVDAEQAEVVADQLDHRRDGLALEQVEPFAFGRVDELVAEFGGEHRADRLQIVARVKPFGDLADVLAQRLAVAQVRRAGERIDLAAGVVDIIFLGDAEACRFEQPGQRIADHRAAAMAHVHRPGRIGRNIFDIDPLVGADRRQAIASPSARIVASSSRQLSSPSRRLMNPGPAISAMSLRVKLPASA